jgi:predicted RNA-binding protein with PUA-like domain
MTGRQYWLMKTEPGTFAWEDLILSPKRTTRWDGVRNYQARTFLRDQVRRGDGVLIYHSSIPAPAAVGTATVVRAGYPDPTQFDPSSPYADPDSPRDQPRWYSVDVRADRALPRPVTLAVMRATPALETMKLLARGNRLSVLPVTSAQWKAILKLGGAGSSPGDTRRTR